MGGILGADGDEKEENIKGQNKLWTETTTDTASNGFSELEELFEEELIAFTDSEKSLTA